jgi:hypothetical protein
MYSIIKNASPFVFLGEVEAARVPTALLARSSRCD